MKTRILLCILFLSLVNPVAGQEPRTTSDFGVMGLAKIMCSAVFVSGRDLDEALRNSGSYLAVSARDELVSKDAIALDRDTGTVQVTLNGFTGRAKFHGDQGCVILPPGFDHVFFEPVKVESTLPRSDDTAVAHG